MQTITNDHRSAINQLHKDFFRAIQLKQDAFISDSLHPEFIFTSPKGAVLDKEGFTKGVVISHSVNFDRMEIAGEEKLIFLQKAAVLNGALLVKFQGKEEQLVRFTTAAIYEETRWILLAFHETYIL
jgi:hypothetical protein